ncbi:MAG: hypothetical protein GF400_08510 [Candidatus Eisenbacteria bacterium]|nr:hypothetical protein [Candidatus Eisenbacteria bacterium]
MGGKITAIESAAEGLPLTVYVDGRPTLRMSAEMVERLGLSVGMEFPSLDPKDAPGRGGSSGEERAGVRDDEEERVRSAALRLLAVRARSVRELEDRLARKGFGADAVSSVVGRLQDAGLLDDREFARLWAEDRMRLRPVGPRRLRSELTSRRVPRKIVEETVARTYAEHDEDELAWRALSRRAKATEITTREKRRLHGFLLRRGFGYEAIAAAFERLSAGNDDAPTDI